MLEVKNVSLKFGTKTLFENVNLKFQDGECYGLIGANGAGKSTFLKILSKELETTTGEVYLEKNKRLSFLRQDHYMYDEETVINTVLRGNKKLWDRNYSCSIDFKDYVSFPKENQTFDYLFIPKVGKIINLHIVEGMSDHNAIVCDISY